MVITSALHAECRGFEPHLEYGLHSTFFFSFCQWSPHSGSASVRHRAVSFFVRQFFAAAEQLSTIAAEAPRKLFTFLDFFAQLFLSVSLDFFVFYPSFYNLPPQLSQKCRGRWLLLSSSFAVLSPQLVFFFRASIGFFTAA